MSQSITALPPTTVLWVALGGAIGSAARFGVSEAMRRLPVLASLPWATLTVNVLGSLALGWYLRSAGAADAAPQMRAFVAIGLCGGFTTFSSFAFEGAVLLEGGQFARAGIYSALSLVLCVGATFAGFALGRT
jgi:fluoride exporter